MPHLNADTPLLYCHLRREFLYDQQRGHGETVPFVVFGVASVPGRALMFHGLTEEGACIYRLPITALVHRPDAPRLPLDVLQLWDCLSAEVSVTEYDYLKLLRVRTVLKDRQWYDGVYLFTVDWTGSSMADNPGEGGHKCAHILQLENGCYAAQPNNRIQWFEPSFVTRPFAFTGVRPDYLTNNRVWKAETVGKWAAEHTPRLFYDVQQVAPQQQDDDSVREARQLMGLEPTHVRS